MGRWVVRCVECERCRETVWSSICSSDGLPVCFVCISEEYPCVSSLSAALSSSFSKGFMYTAFMLFCLMKIV